MEIDLNSPGAFALLCRCGKPQVQCATHEAAVAPLLEEGELDAMMGELTTEELKAAFRFYFYFSV